MNENNYFQSRGEFLILRITPVSNNEIDVIWINQHFMNYNEYLYNNKAGIL